MPNIREGNLVREEIRPVDGGLSTRAATARRIGAFSNELAGAMDDVATSTRRAYGSLESAADTAGAVVDKVVTSRQISQGAAAVARKSDELTRQWNETVKTADPNDPTVAAKFREGLEADLEKLKGGFLTEGGQRWAESQVQSLRNHFFEKTAADMATLAGVAAQKNAREVINSLSNTVRGDPSSLDFALKTLDGAVGGMVGASPNLTGVAAVKVREEIAEKGKDQIIKSAALGYIQRTGEVPPWATEPRFSKYINGAELKQYEQAAKAFRRADEADAERRELRLKRQKEAFSDAKRDEYVQNIFSDKPTVTMRDVLQDRTLVPRDREHLIGVLRREDKPEPLARVSHETTVDLMTKIGSGEIVDTGPIYEAFGKGNLSRSDFNFLVKEVRDARTPEGERLAQSTKRFVDAVKTQITKANPLMGKLDQEGDEKLYQFEMALRAKIAEYRRTPGKNPYDLLDPSKPDYMGTPEALQPYRSSMRDSMEAAQRALRSKNLTGDGSVVTGIKVENAPPRPVPPRNPGESPEAYLNRIGAR